MRTPITLLIAAPLLLATAHAAPQVTYYRNGALYQHTATAGRGIIDLPLSEEYLAQSLTVTPGKNSTITSVDIIATTTENKTDQQRESLLEQRKRLEDRLQALETREAIFTAAAKSQSGKAPRKSKTNPDPLNTIRQGTDFAITQLETVYTARRKAQQEIKKIDEKLTALRTSTPHTGRTLRVSVTPAKGTATIRYATSESGWRPRYNLHLERSGQGRLDMYALLTREPRGYQVTLSQQLLEQSGTPADRPVAPGSAPLASYRLPVSGTASASGAISRFSGTLTNSTAGYLPPGDTSLFRNGTYLGRVRFGGFSSGRTVTVTTD